MKRQHENKGITLIELIVSFAILIIVSGAIIGFTITSTHLYKNVNAETNLQYEAQLTNNQIHDMLIGASKVNYYIDGYDKQYQDPKNLPVGTKKTLQIENFSDADDSSLTKKVMIYEITYEEGKLYYTSYPQGSSTKDGPYLLSQDVTDFKVYLSNPDESSDVAKYQVKYVITHEINGRSYTTENTVSLRNNATVNTGDLEIPDEYISTVTAVNVKPAEAVVLTRNSTYTFLSEVIGTNNPSQDVTWSIEGQNDNGTGDKPGTSIGKSSGILTMGSAETSQEIKIIATSVQNSSVSNRVSNTVSSVAETSYLEDASFKDISVIDKTNGISSFTVKLTITGKKLKKADIDGSISLSFTDGNGSAVSDCSVGSLTSDDGDVSDSITYLIPVQCNVQGVTRKIVAYLTYPASGDTVTTAFQFSTTAAPSIKPIKNVIVTRTDSQQISVVRGKSATYSVKIVREGDTDTNGKAPSEDKNCSVSWDLGSATAYAVLSLNDDTASITISKDSSALNYNTFGTGSITATVVDTANANNKTAGSQNFTVPQVKINYCQVDSHSNTMIAYSSAKPHFITYNLCLSGISFSNADEFTSKYLHWKNGAVTTTVGTIQSYDTSAYNMSINADASFSISFKPKLNSSSSSSSSADIIDIGDIAMSNSNVSKDITYTFYYENVYKKNNAGNYISAGYYVNNPSQSDVGVTQYTSDGIPYKITSETTNGPWNTVTTFYLNINSISYTWYSNYYGWYKK